MLGRLKQLHDRGDTIVEVMIVLAVLGLAIGISYATANRSLLNARQAQENSQAANFAQSQVEALRTLAASTNPSQNIFQAGPYCISQTTPYTVQTGAACKVGSIPYTLAITYSAPTFTVKVTWPDIIVPEQDPDTLTLSYRLYAPTGGVPTPTPAPTPAPTPTPEPTPEPEPTPTPTCVFPETGTPPDCHLLSL